MFVCYKSSAYPFFLTFLPIEKWPTSSITNSLHRTKTNLKFTGTVLIVSVPDPV